jgi:tumor protein p53-inducible protein 3
MRQLCVFGFTGGGNAEYVTCPESQLMRIPQNLNYLEAAAIPETWITAFQLLHAIGELLCEIVY